MRRFSIFEFLAERTQIRGIGLHMTHFEHHHRDDTRRWQFIKASTVAINSTLAPPSSKLGLSPRAGVRSWHLADNSVAPAFIRLWPFALIRTRALNGRY